MVNEIYTVTGNTPSLEHQLSQIQPSGELARIALNSQTMLYRRNEP